MAPLKVKLQGAKVSLAPLPPKKRQIEKKYCNESKNGVPFYLKSDSEQRNQELVQNKYIITLQRHSGTIGSAQTFCSFTQYVATLHGNRNFLQATDNACFCFYSKGKSTLLRSDSITQSTTRCKATKPFVFFMRSGEQLGS